MKKKTAYLAALSLALVMSTSLGTAWSYFTTNDSASGGYTLDLGNVTQIGEDPVTGGAKHVYVDNNEDSGPVYVRIRAFAGSDVQDTLLYEGTNWAPGGDGYWYYSEILQPGERTEQLDIVIPKLTAEVDPDAAEPPQSFNVAVVSESTPVQYDEAGTAYADWNIILDTGSGEGGAEG